MVPRIRYPDELPISQRRGDIATAIADHQVVIVAGETGSGKTTQLPKICLDLGRGATRRIGHTQPRRIAARSVAERIAEELDTPLGDLVGYQVRFADHSSAQTRIKVMTDGILLAELQHDRLLSAYDTLIIDEAHERSLNIDFIVGYLKQLLPRRPDLKIVITSATIDPEKFSTHFGGAPIVEVSGRTYPVEVLYRPLVAATDLDSEGEVIVRDQTEAVVAAVRELSGQGPGDILVFLPGEREIRDTADALRVGVGSGAGLEVLPLFARLSAAEQHRVFTSHPGRRVVLATNVAETSLTVPGIRYVVDTGLARVSRYSFRTKVQRLPIEPVSRASAMQRSGRCGRVDAGVCIRLYAEADFAGRREFTEPEILRTNLASVILQMTALGLGDVGRFPFLDPPDQRNVKAGVQLLEELGAFAVKAPSSGRRLTKVGRRLAVLPIDPRLARMVLEAERLGCLREVLAIVAELSIQDPRERPAELRAQADQAHARFRHTSSDFLTTLNLWRYLREQQKALSSSAFRRMCRAEFLNYLRIREWQELEAQLRQVCRQLKLHPSPPAPEPDEDGIHQALLAGLLSHVGLRDPEPPGPARRGDYLGARNTRFSIFPGSGLFRKQPQLVMAAELVETSRLYARVNAAIKPEWAEHLGRHLVKRSYAEPHWSARRAAVLARERVTLYGVALISDRLVNYGGIDPVTSRELFIRHALVYGEWRTRHAFLQHNRALLDEVEELEHRARRRDILVDEETLFDFYDERVGVEAVSGAHFDTWWKRTRRDRPDLLTFDPEMLVNDTASEVLPEDYPDLWREDGLSLPLRYHFEPGASNDGVTVDVPVSTLNQVSPDGFGWQVPGLRLPLVTALIRSLPKSLRIHFVPVPDVAAAFLAAVPAGEEPLTVALGRFLRGRSGIVIPSDGWDWSKVPEHLRPTFRVVDDDDVLAQGKDLEGLREQLRPTLDDALAAASGEIAVSGQVEWSFGTIEQTFSRRRAGHEVVGYPALRDEGSSVGLVVLGSAEEAVAIHRLGVRRLIRLAVPSPDLAQPLTNAEKLTLAGSPYPSVAELLDDCLDTAVDALVGDPPWDEATFAAALSRVGRQLVDTARAVLADVLRVLAAWRDVDRSLSGRVDLPLLPALADMRAQLGRLVRRGFIADFGASALRELPRYLAAVAVRRARLDESVGRDRLLMDQVVAVQEAYLHRLEALPEERPVPALLRDVGWMIEEFRVSLFAQSLGTPYPISAARITKALSSR